MSDGANFRVTLVDGVSPAAKPAAQALGGLESRLGAVDRDLKSAARAANSFANALAGVRSKSAGSFGMQAWGSGARQSGPAGWRQTTQAIQQAERATRGAEGSTRRWGETARNSLSTIYGLSTRVVGVATGIAAAFGGVSATVGRSVLEMLRFRESAVTTLGVLGGGRGRAAIGAVGSAEFRRTQALARITPADERGVMEARQQIASGGFGRGESERVMAASLDVAALQSGNSQAQGSFVRALSQIRGRGAFQAEELNQLSEVGVSRDRVFQALARQLGLRQTGTAANREIMRRMQAGQVSGAAGIEAVLASVSDQTGMGLGGFARAQGESLGGAMSNLEGSLFGLFTSMDPSRMAGVQAFTRSIQALGNALNGSSPAGQKLLAVLTGLVNRVFGRLGWMLTPERIEGFVSTLAGVIPTVERIAGVVGGELLAGLRAGIGPLVSFFGIFTDRPRKSTRMLGDMARGLGLIVGLAGTVVGVVLAGVGGIGWLANAIVGLGYAAWNANMAIISAFASIPFAIMGAWNSVWGFFSQVVGAFANIGASIVDGLVSGLTGAWGRLTGTLTQLASALPGPVRSALGIASPSKVFADLGRQLPAGMALGIEEGSPVAQTAAEALVTPPAAPGGVGAGATITVQVNVDGSGAGTPQALGDAVAAAVEQVLVDLFGRAALVGGA